MTSEAYGSQSNADGVQPPLRLFNNAIARTLIRDKLFVAFRILAAPIYKPFVIRPQVSLPAPQRGGGHFGSARGAAGSWFLSGDAGFGQLRRNVSGDGKGRWRGRLPQMNRVEACCSAFFSRKGSTNATAYLYVNTRGCALVKTKQIDGGGGDAATLFFTFRSMFVSLQATTTRILTLTLTSPPPVSPPPCCRCRHGTLCGIGYRTPRGSRSVPCPGQDWFRFARRTATTTTVTSRRTRRQTLTAHPCFAPRRTMPPPSPTALPPRPVKDKACRRASRWTGFAPPRMIILRSAGRREAV